MPGPVSFWERGRVRTGCWGFTADHRYASKHMIDRARTLHEATIPPEQLLRLGASATARSAHFCFQL